MFNYAANITMTPSDPAITMADDSFSYSGTSKKITFGVPGTAILNFDNLSGHSEISFYLYSPGYLQANKLKVTINGKIYEIDYFKGWKYFLFRTSSDVSNIALESSDYYIYFIDVIGGRTVSEEKFDDDIPQAFKDHISLSSPFQTSISTIDKSGRELTFADESGILDRSTLSISNGVLIENVRMINKKNFLSMINTFSQGDGVSVICPVEIAENLEFSDPGIGIEISEDPLTKEISRIETMDGQFKAYEYKEKLVYVLLRCSDRSTFKKLSAEYAKKYGERFFMLYDGRYVCIYSERNPVYEKDGDGRYYNAMYVYRITPSMIVFGDYYDTVNYLLDVQSV